MHVVAFSCYLRVEEIMRAEAAFRKIVRTEKPNFLKAINRSFIKKETAVEVAAEQNDNKTTSSCCTTSRYYLALAEGFSQKVSKRPRA